MIYRKGMIVLKKIIGLQNYQTPFFSNSFKYNQKVELINNKIRNLMAQGGVITLKII